MKKFIDSDPKFLYFLCILGILPTKKKIIEMEKNLGLLYEYLVTFLNDYAH